VVPIITIGIGLVHFVHLAPYSFYSIWTAPKISWRVAILLSLLALILSSLFLPSVILGSVFIAIFFAVLYPFYRTMEGKYLGRGEIFSEAIDRFVRLMEKWWKFGSEFKHELTNFKSSELAPGELPADVDFLKITAGILLLPIGWICVTPVIVLITAMKFVPSLFLLTFQYWKEAKSNFRYSKLPVIICIFPFFLAGHAFVPVVAILCLAVLWCHAVVIPFGLPIQYYVGGSLPVALQFIPAVLRHYDVATTRAFKKSFNVCDPYNGTHFSCFNYCVPIGFTNDKLRDIVETIVIFRID